MARSSATAVPDNPAVRATTLRSVWRRPSERRLTVGACSWVSRSFVAICAESALVELAVRILGERRFVDFDAEPRRLGQWNVAVLYFELMRNQPALLEKRNEALCDQKIRHRRCDLHRCCTRSRCRIA